MTHQKQNQVLDFWFGDNPLRVLDQQDKWFKRDERFDEEIRTQFAGMVADASTGAFDDWAKTARGALALVILLDQFPRNLFRGDARSYEADPHARRIAEIAIEHGLDQQLSAVERAFLYLPFEHSEDVDAQRRSVRLFENLINEALPEEKAYVTQALSFALVHRDIIERFGRFPHRNDVLGRASQRDEIDFLKTSLPFY